MEGRSQLLLYLLAFFQGFVKLPWILSAQFSISMEYGQKFYNTALDSHRVSLTSWEK